MDEDAWLGDISAADALPISPQGAAAFEALLEEEKRAD